MDKTMSAPRLVSVKTAAEILGVSIWTIRMWAYSGKICSHKLGKRLMVSTAEIDRIVTESVRPRLEQN
jgi:excisionase family DNA binding protein